MRDTPFAVPDLERSSLNPERRRKFPGNVRLRLNLARSSWSGGVRSARSAVLHLFIVPAGVQGVEVGDPVNTQDNSLGSQTAGRDRSLKPR
jgi:hypothetical protein